MVYEVHHVYVSGLIGHQGIARVVYMYSTLVYYKGIGQFLLLITTFPDIDAAAFINFEPR